MNSMSLIASRGRNGELGRGNDLVWRFHDDMKFFRRNTVGKDIVMGRKTFESLPGLLPKRKHIVLTRGDIDNPEVVVFHDKEDVLQYAYLQDHEVVVIGGATIYKMFIDDVDRMLLTEIDATCSDADVFFPSFNYDDWNRNVLGYNEEDNIKFEHVEYVRKLKR